MRVLIDDKECEASYGEYLLQVAKRNNIYIPTLCHSEALPGEGSCRLCIVEVIDKGHRKVVTSCIYPITKEITVVTNSKRIMNMRKTIIRLLSARVPNNETVRKLREEFDIKDLTRFSKDNIEQCILCGLCVKACEKLGTSAISAVNRGVTKKISTPYDEPSLVCIGCGACAYVCPTKAINIIEDDGRRRIWGKEFQLIKCESCGEYYATKEEVEFSTNKLNKTSIQNICRKCRKKFNAEKLKEIYADYK